MAIVETLRELSDVGTFKEGKHSRTELVEHLDQRRAVDVLSAVQEELEEWEIVDEQYQIAKVESEDQEVLEETQTARNQALDQLVRGVVERALLPAARRYLNRSAEIDESSALSQVTASGLHQLLPRDFELQTEAATSVSRIIDQTAHGSNWHRWRPRKRQDDTDRMVHKGPIPRFATTPLRLVARTTRLRDGPGSV